MRRIMATVIAVASMVGMTGVATAAPTTVPGHSGSKVDTDNNGFPDVGVVVVGHFTSLYAYDGNGDWYWDLGDGRILGTVASFDDLDDATLNTCDYVNQYRGTFENNPYQDSGWISNHINCNGTDGHGHWNYLMVHSDDPRFTGDVERSQELGWGPDWEFKILTESGSGSFFKVSNPHHAV